jgi:hypothetical protein
MAMVKVFIYLLQLHLLGPRGSDKLESPNLPDFRSQTKRDPGHGGIYISHPASSS